MGAARRAVVWSLAHQRLVSLAIVLSAAPVFMLAHHLDPSTPRPGAPGWWGWIDQGRYIEAARAWASLSLDPARHWYAPGYPLLAAPFARAMPDDPFYIPDLVCLLASGLLFAALGQRLAPTLPGARILAASVFLAELLGSRLMLRSFVEPWTSTPTAPLAFAVLLLGFRFQDRPAPGVAALLGFAAAAALLFRPADAVVLTAVAGAFAALVLFVRWPGPRRAAAIAAAGASGAAVVALLALLLHWVIHGLDAGGYLLESQAVGFEWRLLAFRWVTVMAASAPLLDGETSLSQAFPWIIPGFAGMAASLVVAQGRLRARHALTIAVVLAHTALYLTYRDLQPQGVIRFGNYHYFRWAIMLLGLYGALLVALTWLSRRGLPAWGLGIATVFALFSWRASWTEAPGYAALPAVSDGRTLVLDGGLHRLLDGVWVSADGSFDAIYLGPHTMAMAGNTWRASIDFKTWPAPGGLILTLQRPILNETLTLSTAPGVTLAAAPPPRLLRAVLTPGLPWFLRRTS